MPSAMLVPIDPVLGCGSDVCVQDFPPSFVVMTVARRLSTATTQLLMEGQETRESLSSPLGNDRCVQILPESRVIKATPRLPSGASPTATQNAFVGHETPLSAPTPGGMMDLTQVSPPSAVLSASPPSTGPVLAVPPTATHDFVDGQESAGAVSIRVDSEKLAQWTPPSEVVAAMADMV